MTTGPSSKQWRGRGCRTWRGKGLLCMREKKKASQKTRRRTGEATTTLRTAGEDDTEVDQWPWGSRGRPSDRDGATGRLAEKTNEPIIGEPPSRSTGPSTAAEAPGEPDGEPPRRSSPRQQETRRERNQVNLVPNLSWQVRQVQAHAGENFAAYPVCFWGSCFLNSVCSPQSRLQ